MVRRISDETQLDLRRDYSQMTLTEIATLYAETGNLEAREKLATLYQLKVESVARYFYNKTNGRFDLDDFISDGNLALVKSIEKYNPKRGNFEGYTDMKIRKSMIDTMRNNDFISRESKERLKIMRKFSSDFKEKNGFLPSYQDYKKEWKKLDYPKDSFDYFYFEVLDKSRPISLNLHVEETHRTSKATELGDILSYDARIESNNQENVIELFGEDLRSIKERDRNILHKHLLGGYTLKEAGREEGISESTTSTLVSGYVNSPLFFNRVREYFGNANGPVNSRNRKRNKLVKVEGFDGVLNQSA